MKEARSIDVLVCDGWRDGWTIGWMVRERCGHKPLTAVHTGRFNLLVNRRDQGWAPQILPQLPWMGGASLPRGINTGGDGGREGGRDEERKRIPSHRGTTRATRPQGDQARVIR